MRSFDERRAEIFRRSGERIKKRKKAKRIMLTCIPLFVCVILWSVVLLGQQNKSSFTSDSATNTNTYFEDDCAPPPAVYTAVEVLEQDKADGYYKKTDEPLKIDKINKFIEAVVEASKTVADDYTDQIQSETDANDATKSTSYEIKFIMTNGSTKSFVLNGNKLLSKADNAVYSLSDSQLGTLKALLGLTE